MQAQDLIEQCRFEGFVFPETTKILPDGNIAVSDRREGGSTTGEPVSRIAADGAVIAMDWVTGLANPLSMPVSSERFYFVDGVVGLQVIDIASGRLLDPIPPPEAQLQNDMAAAPEGTFYVTDMAQGGVMEIRDGAAGWLASANSIPAANGIAWIRDWIVVGTLGEGFDPSDFNVEAPGSLVSVDPAIGVDVASEATRNSAGVDGVVSLDGTLIFNVTIRHGPWTVRTSSRWP